MRHQIGMAKPYGLGTIRIKTKLVIQNRKYRYQQFFEKDNSGSSGDEQGSVSNFKQKFENCLIEFCKEIYKKPKLKSLDEIPRIRQLFEMLKWNPKEHLDKKRYCDLQYLDNRGRKKPEPQWKDRYVLPYPEHINSGLAGEIGFYFIQNSIEKELMTEKLKHENQSVLNHTFQTRPLILKKKTDDNK